MTQDRLMTAAQPRDHTTAHLDGAPMRDGRAGPLSDIRVVDLSQALAGPFCTMMLADMGADVIKVEPPGGDGLRLVGPYTEVDDAHHFGGYFACNNRNKRGITLDLKDPADIEVLLRLVDTADVLVENFRAGVMERLGLSYEFLHERNPRMIYAAVRGFGDPRTGEGPYTDWPAYDIVAQAMGGVISHTGPLGGELVASGPNVGDIYPATVAAVGVLAALHEAKQTGVGQFVDISMLDSVISMCESMTWRYAYTGETMTPGGAQHPSISPFELYDCADGQIAIAAPAPPQWGPLCEIIGRPDMIDHDKFRSARRRVLHRDEVRAAITRWTINRTRADVIAELGGQVPCGPVNSAADLAADPHVKARGMLVAVDHPGSDRPVLTPNTPVRFLNSPTGIYRAAPKLGEHTEEVLAELDRDTSTKGSATHSTH